MSQDEKNIEELLAAHFSGETSPAEEASIAGWLKNAENLAYYNSLKTIFTKAKTARKEFDTDAAWNAVKSRLNQEGGRVIPFFNPTFYRIAAVLVLVAGISAWFIITNNSNREIPIASTTGETKEIILADQSTVLLNRNSSISYIGNKKRKVRLQGEAFFKVVHNVEDPFTVETNGLTITDVGTEFNVRNFGNDSVIVYVTEGEVAFASSDSSVSLKAGDKSVYRKSDKSFAKVNSDPNEIAYKTKILVFENASLAAVIQKLYEVYGKRVSIDPKLEECHITATFRNEEFNTVLDVIAETLKLSVIRENGKITMEGEGCGF